MKQNYPKLLYIVLLSALLFTNCGGGGGGGSQPDNSGSQINDTVPQSPMNVVASAGNKSIDIEWSDVDNATNYNLYYSLTSGEDLSLKTKIENVRSPYTHASIVNGIYYYYIVTAVNDSGEGQASIEVSALPLNPEPVIVLNGPHSGVIHKQVTFDASLSSEYDGQIINYEIDFGDGSSTVNQDTPVFNHIFSEFGTFTVSLTVTYEDESTSSEFLNFNCRLSMSPPINISNTPELLNHSANVSVDNVGNINIIYIDTGSFITFVQSQNGGQTFSEPISIMGHEYVYNAYYAQIISIEDSIQLVWGLYDQNGGAEILYTRSTNRGISFEDPIIISEIDGNNSIAPSIASGRSGFFGITWGNYNSNSTFIHSPDNGDSFSSSLAISDYYCTPKIAIYEDNVYMAWNKNRTIYFTQSSDRGLTFTEPVIISTGEVGSNNPNIKVNNDNQIFITWVNTGNELIITNSINNGDSFIERTVIELGSDKNLHDFIIDDSGTIFLTLVENRKMAYLMYSTDNALSFSNQVPLHMIKENVFGIKMAMLNSDQLIYVWNSEPYPLKVQEIYCSIVENPAPK